MDFENEILVNSDFNYKTFVVDDLSIGDSYLKIQNDDIKDIYVFEQPEKISLQEKYNLLNTSKGFVHLKQQMSLEINKSEIISLKLDTLIRKINLKTKVDIEKEFGKADYELMDGIMWAVGYSIESKILVYNTLNLYLHIDPETNILKAIEFGKIDTTKYD